ncbi:MAG: helix-turn-helix domain-containing protein [Clostridia bacterium]|nr:helix-turn-helix domain-containing protein [Clostridia bacterium]
MTYNRSFGTTLKLLRTSRRLSQRQLARELNVAPSTLAMYELDKREPDYATLRKIADYFEVTTDYLLGRSNKLYPNEKIAEEGFYHIFEELPEEAKKTLEDFIEYIHIKYRKDKKE